MDKEISVQVRAEDVMMDMNRSIPLILLVNEILTNALKHAFTDRKTGRIEVDLEKKEDGYLPAIQDDGVGLADIDQLNNPESFGYTIIHGLSQQLRGQLEFSLPSQGGLGIEACFPGEIEI